MKKTCKGMSLIEIVVSMLVYGMIALVAVEVMVCVNSMILSTTNLNRRLSYETKYADNFIVSDNGGNFDSAAVDVDIVYGLNRDATGQIEATSRQRLSSALGGSNHFLGTMYTAHYSTDDGTGTYTADRDGTNYRFMTFSKLSIRTASTPPAMFPVTLHLESVSTSDILEVWVYDSTEANKGSVTPTKYSGAAVKNALTYLASQDPNIESAPAAIGTHTIYVEFYKNMANSSNPQDLAFGAELRYCTYVTSTAGSKNYVQNTHFNFSYDASTLEYSMTAEGSH